MAFFDTVLGASGLLHTMKLAASFTAANTSNAQLLLGTIQTCTLCLLAGWTILSLDDLYRDSPAPDVAAFDSDSCHADQTTIAPEFGGHEKADTDGSEQSFWVDTDEETLRNMRNERLADQGGWVGCLSGYSFLAPYMLSGEDHKLRLWLVLSLVCMVAERILALLVPRQLAIATDELAKSVGTGKTPIKALAVYMVLQLPLSTAVSWLKNMSKARLGQSGLLRLKTAALSHIMNLSMDYHTSKSTGQVIGSLEQGTNVSETWDNAMTSFSLVADLVIASSYAAAAIEFKVGYIMLISILLSLYISFKGYLYINYGLKEMGRTGLHESSLLYDIISNWYNVVIHGRGTYELERYSESVISDLKSKQEYAEALEASFMLQSIVMDCGFFAAMYITACQAANAGGDISNFIFLSSYWQSVASPVSALAWSFQDLLKGFLNLELLHELLSKKPSVQDKPFIPPLKFESGQIEFRNVTFSYDMDKTILHNISFSVKAGQTVAFVGETGSGKSTILKLVSRFYDACKGNIEIDDQDLRDVTIQSLRESMGIVPQEPSALNETIRQSVKYGREGATDDEVVEACMAAQLHEQICSFPQGYDTIVGEHGVRLSGGELQRLVIARLILRRPKIVLLDEPTSSIDSKTESRVQTSLRNLTRGRTTIIVAHRLSTVAHADQIIVVDKGKLVEQGTHQELIKRGGRYADLWALQTACS